MSNYETPPPVPPIAQVYSAENARPGLVTAIGIVSIILAAWFILMSFIMVAYMFIMSAIAIPTVTTTSTPGPTTSGVTITQNTSPFNEVSFDPSASTVTWMCVANGINFLASIALLIAGIATLRRKRAGEWLHKRWAVAKILIVLVLVVAEFMYYQDFYDLMLNAQANQANSMPAGFTTVMSAFIAILWGVFSLIYPVTLLFLLRMRSIREYFATQTT